MILGLAGSTLYLANEIEANAPLEEPAAPPDLTRIKQKLTVLQFEVTQAASSASDAADAAHHAESSIGMMQAMGVRCGH